MNDQYQPPFDPQQMKFYHDQFNKYRRRKVWLPLVALVCVLSFGGMVLILGLWLLTYIVSSKIEQVACPSATVCYAIGKDFLVSTDGGATWNNHPLINGRFNDISCPTVNTCFAIGGDNIQFSNDGGRNWTIQYTNRDYYFNAVACTDATNCRVQINHRGRDSFYRNLVTTNGGKDWNIAPLETTDTIVFKDAQPSAKYKVSSHITPSDIDPNYHACPNPNTCFVISRYETTIVGATKDGGKSWQRQIIYEAVAKLTKKIQPSSSGQHTYDLFELSTIACADTQTCLIAGSQTIKKFDTLEVIGKVSSGVLVTTDGGATWTGKPMNPEIQFKKISCATNQRCVALTNDNRIFLTENIGDSWREVYQA